MLSIDNLHAQVEGKGLNGINLDIKPGEVHAVMGPMAQEKYAFRSHCRARGL